MSIYGASPRGGYKQQPERTPRSLGFARHALDFDGVNDYIDVPLHGFPDVMTDITIAFRTRPSGRLDISSTFLAVPDDTANRINIHFPQNNALVFWDFGNIAAGGRLHTPTQWDTTWNDVWSYWAFSSESGVGQRILRNAVLLVSNNTWSSFSKGTKTLRIGGLGPEYWKGLIAEVLVYNRALRIEEIQYNMLNYHNPVRSGLALWLPMEEGAGETVFDKSGFGGHGTLLPAGTGPTWERLRQWELRAATE